MNLLDVRPGRALKGFFLLTALIWTCEYYAHTPTRPYAPNLFLLPLVFAALIYAPFDFRCQVMMGDVGSNSLGAIAGIYATWTLPLWAKAILVFAFAALHLITERVSLTQIIEGNRVLKFLDGLGVTVNSEQ
jgi:UDP-N-acetylmuramyl pentapeptide phosphotransferase/UDP-N-acetylglucosamine-1-phosphate transferase